MYLFGTKIVKSGYTTFWLISVQADFINIYIYIYMVMNEN